MKLSYEGLRDAASWQQAGIALPKHDFPAMVAETKARPVWVHFGAGNIFRGFIAGLQQRLLNEGLQNTGIVAVETYDPEVISRIYEPHDSMTLAVALRPDGSTDKAVQAGIACGLFAGDPAQMETLRNIFRNPSLQMVSFTITEKGYAIRDMKGELMASAAADMAAGPESRKNTMGIVASLLYDRFLAGGAPLAVVSMDNCSHNGEKLKSSVTAIAEAWQQNGLVRPDFVAWLEDEGKVSFPWSMIDKITPRPSPIVEKTLSELGVEDMAPVVTEKHTFIAPFVNAEVPQYLVIEDRFPNGRPPLEKAGVYMTDRDTVNNVERMKVTTCLNPLHTALSVFGCLLGYTLICDEMKDADLVALVRQIGYVEGLPVVTDPGIISPRSFIDEVVTERLPNPFMPDAPQRIACDTSQKLAIRFGETIKSYLADPEKDAASLTAIPLAIAGWLRYLLGVDDKGEAFSVSPDPMLPMLQQELAGVVWNDPESLGSHADALLENASLFGVSLTEAGLAGKVKAYLVSMLQGAGSVRSTLHQTLQNA